MRADPITATCYTGIYPGRADQVSHVRRAMSRHLAGCPAADDAILVVSELASNAVVFFLLSSCVAIAALPAGWQWFPGWRAACGALWSSLMILTFFSSRGWESWG